MKKSSKKILIFCGIIAVLTVVLYFFNMRSTPKDISATQQEIEVFNTIISQASNKADIENCSNIGNKELEGICKSQLENRFSPLYQADNISICLSDKDELKQDMCILDLAYSQAKNISETGLCNEIKNQDIKDACFAQVMNKKF